MTATVMVSPDVCCQSILADLYGARSASCAAAWRSIAEPNPISAAAALPVFRKVRLVVLNDFIPFLPWLRLVPVKLGHLRKCYNKSNRAQRGAGAQWHWTSALVSDTAVSRKR